ncbi:MAG: hypothetical protein ACW98Y_13425 [Candidatus Thorarchaeota archaeon]|jgi:uncharacterized Zn finger protein (UPF0148 family)
MTDSITCPSCKTSLRKGSTFCMKCGTALNGDGVSSTTEHTHDSAEITTNDDATLPEIEDWSEVPKDTDDLMAATLAAVSESETLMSEEKHSPPEVELPPEDDLSWEEGIETPEVPDVTLEDSILEEDPVIEEPTIDEPIIEEPPAVEPTSRDLSWETPEEYSSEIKEGMPFTEVAPPTVMDADVVDVSEAKEHLFTDAPDEDTREAVTHLFPHGRGDTSPDFIDVVVGKPKKIGSDITPTILETPTCPDCGGTVGSDSFEYPPYVYDAMGKARMNYGVHLLKELDHESAIEQFEIAKKLFEHGGITKMVEEATKRVDEGYDAMAEHHYIQGENHLKEKQYDWGIVVCEKHMSSGASVSRMRVTSYPKQDKLEKHLQSTLRLLKNIGKLIHPRSFVV